MRHIKQFHSPTQVLIEMTPVFPLARMFLYKEEDYGGAALDHLRFKFSLTRNTRMSDSERWSTYQCDDFLLIYETAMGGVYNMTLMAKDIEFMTRLESSLEGANLMGDRMAVWGRSGGATNGKHHEQTNAQLYSTKDYPSLQSIN